MSTPEMLTVQALRPQPVKERPRRLHNGSDSVTSQKRTGNRKRKHVEQPLLQPSGTVSDALITRDKIRQPTVTRVGDYYLGPELGKTPVKSVRQYLARKLGSDDFFIMKMMTLKEVQEPNNVDYVQGKELLLTEHSILSLLKDEEGVFQGRGLFKTTMEETITTGESETVTKQFTKICLVIDCFVSHDFSPKYKDITNLHELVLKEKTFKESYAIRIFYKVVKIVERIHKLNIVHRDLKLGTMILNKATGEVKLANFCLSVHQTSDNDRLRDQRGSPSYISPDVIVGKPYAGKPSDMWALGVSLYAMLYGKYPFHASSPSDLFRKIKTGQFEIPVDFNVSYKTVELIKSLLVLNPLERPTASKVVKTVESIICAEESLMHDSDLQVVPIDYHVLGNIENTFSILQNDVSAFAILDFEAFVAKTIGSVRSSDKNATLMQNQN
ncbi:unnamed protein product [Orchesella dallaii]|uniref:Protein kinase domain-containing protein n=1 Tax=Orchesella dallaii TaxID=48710 RepID=A0ABP1PJG7_9HEXA